VTPQPTTRSGQQRRRPNRAEKRSANREAILAAARSVFGERGFHAATIEEIADRAGLSNGAIYYNFESKGELFFALMKERQDERIHHMKGLLKAEDADRAGALAEETRDASRVLKESPHWRLLLFEFAAHAARNPPLARKLREHKRAFRGALADVLSQYLQRQGAPQRIEPGELGLISMALTNGLALEEIADPGSVPDDLLSDLLSRLVGS
jgi:AcrR family transcriptional regulator